MPISFKRKPKTKLITPISIEKAIDDCTVENVLEFIRKQNLTDKLGGEQGVEEIANEVIANKWGSGTARKQALESAGYNYSEVQAKVNEILKVQNNVKINYYPKYTGSATQLDTILAAIGVPVTLRGNASKRIPIAKANGITKYTGTAAQNTTLIKLAKTGKLIKP